MTPFKKKRQTGNSEELTFEMEINEWQYIIIMLLLYSSVAITNCEQRPTENPVILWLEKMVRKWYLQRMLDGIMVWI